MRKDILEKKKNVSLLACMMMLMLPLISYAATNKHLTGQMERFEYGIKNGSLSLQAYPDYSKSRCNLVHVKAFEDRKFVMNTVKEVYDRNYALGTPYTPNTLLPLFPTDQVFLLIEMAFDFK